MSEILSPAGTVEAFYAAISNGANAIYLGLDKFSARAYASNFTIEKLKQLVPYAHLRNVKIYVTINTIVYDSELPEVYKNIDDLASIGVDAIIVQDLAVLNYIKENYVSIEAHASTQMGIDDVDGAKLVKSLGATRVVFARETSIETIKQIRTSVDIETEAFIHGALCVSYSGNCLMSSLIGDRSGNRGRCAGCCRRIYTLVNNDSKEELNTSYLFSLKDLNTSKYISDLCFIDSLKIEGRMKEPFYVGAVTRTYRELLDKKVTDLDVLNKVFNRTYTKGYILGDSIENLSNINKANNNGYLIGTVTNQRQNKVWISLKEPLSKGDQIVIETKSLVDEISLPITRLFDLSFNLIEEAKSSAIIVCDRRINIGANVYKVKDKKFENKVAETFENREYTKLKIDGEFKAKIGQPIIFKIKYAHTTIVVQSSYICEISKTYPVSKDNIIAQLSKLNDTPYYLNNLSIIIDDNLFIPLREINELRREAISQLNEKRLAFKVINKVPTSISPQPYKFVNSKITIQVTNNEQYQMAKSLGFEDIYFNNIIKRNNANYSCDESTILVGGLGGINHYKNQSFLVSDSMLNVVNSPSVAILSSLGVNRITLSHEICKNDIQKLISQYKEDYQTDPNLELVVYGRVQLMHTKYCPLKKLNMCGKCKTSSFSIKDSFATFPLYFNDDCTVNILNSRPLNIMDKLSNLEGISAYRLIFTNEDLDEMKNILIEFKNYLYNNGDAPKFNSLTQTRGHFLVKPL